jgi:hypothetical protein
MLSVSEICLPLSTQPPRDPHRDALAAELRSLQPMRKEYGIPTVLDSRHRSTGVLRGWEFTNSPWASFISSGSKTAGTGKVRTLLAKIRIHSNQRKAGGKGRDVGCVGSLRYRRKPSKRLDACIAPGRGSWRTAGINRAPERRARGSPIGVHHSKTPCHDAELTIIWCAILAPSIPKAARLCRRQVNVHCRRATPPQAASVVVNFEPLWDPAQLE